MSYAVLNRNGDCIEMRTYGGRPLAQCFFRGLAQISPETTSGQDIRAGICKSRSQSSINDLYAKEGFQMLARKTANPWHPRRRRSSAQAQFVDVGRETILNSFGASVCPHDLPMFKETSRNPPLNGRWQSSDRGWLSSLETSLQDGRQRKSWQDRKIGLYHTKG
eukprot:gnl/MRDRNA2_/MRDRNA2_180882_c0_seq1.p1 gnl/MRDRNA2_/MRDRNA2_180882_c0~~gnl/MRDRNA2_/MRDRNA2_180882_c0_seq1.p1  ORF type:complete len:164 (-),score=19.40 gnl/MRDRNA2_/MRDRNA2_180882_c0_seq1:63-554(-)